MPALRLIAVLIAVAATSSAQTLWTLPHRSERDRRVHHDLVRRLLALRLDVDWREVALADALASMRDRTGINLVIATALDADGNTVDLQLRQASAFAVLGLLSDLTGVVFQNRRGIVVATTPADAVAHSARLALYDVRELLYTPPDFPGPRIGIPIGPPGEEEPIEEDEREVRDPAFIVDLVRSSTGEANWEFDGVSIEIANGTLLVRHTPRMQARVRRILTLLRAAL